MSPEITDTWRKNAAKAFKEAGGWDITKLDQENQDYWIRAWGFYVNAGMDFGSAAIQATTISKRTRD